MSASIVFDSSACLFLSFVAIPYFTFFSRPLHMETSKHTHQPQVVARVIAFLHQKRGISGCFIRSHSVLTVLSQCWMPLNSFHLPSGLNLILPSHTTWSSQCQHQHCSPSQPHMRLLQLPVLALALLPFPTTHETAAAPSVSISIAPLPNHT